MKKNKYNVPSAKKDRPTPVIQPHIKAKSNPFINLLSLTLIVILGIIIYSNSFDCSFHLDDMPNILFNKNIQNLSDLGSVWHTSQGRFVGLFTFALNYHFNEQNVWGYHLVNLVIHLANACLVYWLTLLFFSCPSLKESPAAPNKKTIALFTALLFVSHPLATQSVTYIVQRMASLVALFYLLSIAFYIKARLTQNNNTGKFLFFSGSLVSALLALFTKENSFTLPFAIVLVEIFFLQSKKLSINIKDYRIYLFPVVFVSAAIIALSRFPLSIFKPVPPMLGNTYTLTPVNYLLTQFSVIVKYIQLLLLPVYQNVDYDFPVSQGFFEARTMGSFVFLLSLIALAIYFFKKQRIISFGIFWFFLTLSIESSIVPIKDVIFEHRTYLPSFGFFLILSSVIINLLWNKFRPVAIALVLLLIVTNSILTYERNKVWLDEFTLWNDIVSKSPNKARPYVNRALSAQENESMENKIADFSRAIEINPRYVDAYLNRGSAYLDLKQWDHVIADFSKAIEIDPKNSVAHYDCGVAYSELKQLDKANESYNRAIHLDSNYTKAIFNRGRNYGILGQYDKALNDFSRVLKIDPNFKEAYSNLGITHGNLGQWDKAVTDYSKAIGIDPNNPEYYNDRGIAYYYTGQTDKAIADYSKALEIDPKYTNAITNREIAYRKLNNPKK